MPDINVLSGGYRVSTIGAALNQHLIAAGSTNPTSVKASPGKLLGWHVLNTAASVRYLKFHNTATAPTAGTGVVLTVGIPASSSVNFPLEGGIAFSNGIGITTVTGSADADATAVTAGDLIVEVFYV